MQILNVVLYPYRGENMIIPFKENEINLIIGPNDSGKSSIGRIIEYCLGADFKIPGGETDECVSWYGIRIKIRKQEFFIARKHPRERTSNYGSYIKIGNPVDIPPIIKGPNTTKNGIIQTISDRLGIIPKLDLPWPTYDNPTRVGVIESLPFCFQYQDEIQSSLFLFHNIAGEFNKTITKHILPYFLGDIPDNTVKQKFELLKLEREIQALGKKLDEINIIKQMGYEQAKTIILESKTIGILNENEFVSPKTLEDYKMALNKIAEWDPSEINIDPKNILDALQQKSVEFRDQIFKLDKYLDVLSSYEKNYSDYEKRIKHQDSRLQSIDLFSSINGESKKCPLCSNDLKSNLLITDAIKDSVKELHSQLDDVHFQTSTITTSRIEMEKERDELKKKISDNYTEIKVILNQEKENRQRFNDSMRRARISAKADFWSGAVRKSEDEDIEQEIIEKNYLKTQIAKNVDFDSILQKTTNTLKEINDFINEKSKLLKLEYGKYRVEFEPNKQTFWIKKEGEARKLIKQMSGEGWLGYHIITLIGMHRYFQKHDCPVPNFLFLDQPSQVYYSSHEKDFDSKKTNQLYNFLFEIQNENSIQMIITDHANFKDINPEFKKHIRKEFTEVSKLIPDTWPKFDQI